MKIYLGIPFYGGAGAEFVSSLLKLHLTLHLAGYEVECEMNSNCGCLPRVRNETVSRFMASGFDRLLFLDTDMVFDTVDVFKLITSEHDICALDYRKKSDTVEYTATLTGRERDGWQEATCVGAGCLCITREVIEKMQQDHPETRYAVSNEEVAFSLFDYLNHAGKYWGEDVTFCRRAIESGFDIAVLKDASVGHIGTKDYRK